MTNATDPQGCIRTRHRLNSKVRVKTRYRLSQRRMVSAQHDLFFACKLGLVANRTMGTRAAMEAAVATMRTVGRPWGTPRPPAAALRWMLTRPATPRPAAGRQRPPQSSPQQQQPGHPAPVDQTQSIGMMDFLGVTGHRRSSCHCISCQDEKICNENNPLSRKSPNQV